MPLRVTIELIPGGNEAKKRVVEVMNIYRLGEIRKDEKGKEVGDYGVQLSTDFVPGIMGQTVYNVQRLPSAFLFLREVLVALKKTKHSGESSGKKKSGGNGERE